MKNTNQRNLTYFNNYIVSKSFETTVISVVLILLLFTIHPNSSTHNLSLINSATFSSNLTFQTSTKQISILHI